jgi:hypothetical protein
MPLIQPLELLGTLSMTKHKFLLIIPNASTFD